MKNPAAHLEVHQDDDEEHAGKKIICISTFLGESNSTSRSGSVATGFCFRARGRGFDSPPRLPHYHVGER